MKKTLRQEYRTKRKLLINNTVSLEIHKKLYENEKFISSKEVLIYVSTDEEIDTINIIEKCLSLNKLVAVPKIIDDNMEFYYINSLEELINGKYNIKEPINNNKVVNFEDCICITPGIVFDNKGYRLGYGKGYYDRFFAKNNCYKIGLTLNELLVDNIYPDEYDIAVDIIITEKTFK